MNARSGDYEVKPRQGREKGKFKKFNIGTNCGLRISDILRLNVGDVRNKAYIQIVEKKTGKL